MPECPDKVGAVTVNKVCGSGMRAIMDGANSIRTGEYDVVIAGGMESMSNAPHMLPGSRKGTKMGEVEDGHDAMIVDGLWDPYGNKHMGNCGELCAAQRVQIHPRDAGCLRTRELQARPSVDRVR